MKKSKTKHLVGALAITLFSTVALQSINVQAANAGPKKTTEQSKLLASNQSSNKTANFGSLELDDVPDSQEVIFPDPVLEKEVRKVMNFEDDEEMTVGKFRNTKVTYFNFTNRTDIITDFTGMENFKYLPNNLTIKFSANFGNNVVDFSKLEGARYVTLLLKGGFKENDVTGLTGIDTQYMTNLDLNGAGGYQAVKNGLQNEQLEILAPWVTEMYNNSPARYASVNLGYNNLSDFSSLKDLNHNKGGWVVSLGNYVVDHDEINVVEDDVNIVEVGPSFDIDGDDISDTYSATFNGTPNDRRSHTIENLGDGKYKYDPLTIVPNTNFVTYGYYGFIYDKGDGKPYHFEKVYGNDDDYMNGLTLKYDAMIYRKANIQDNPSITVEFVDDKGNELKESKKIDGEKIGDEFDITEDSKIDGYTLVSTSDLTGEFTQNPQTITLVYKADGDTGSGGGDGGNGGGNGGNGGGGGSTGGGDIVDSEQYLTTFADKEPVELFDTNGKKITDKKLAADSDWFSDKKMTLNKTKYYRVATDEWIKEKDAYEYKPESGVVRTYVKATRDDYKDLINAHTNPVNRGLAIGTDWKYDQVAEFNGKKHYRVATHEFVEDKHVHEYKQISGIVTINKKVPLYDEDGKERSRSLDGNVSFKTDRMVTIDGEDYYRVSTNDYVKASDVSYKDK